MDLCVSPKKKSSVVFICFLKTKLTITEAETSTGKLHVLHTCTASFTVRDHGQTSYLQKVSKPKVMYTEKCAPKRNMFAKSLFHHKNKNNNITE